MSKVTRWLLRLALVVMLLGMVTRVFANDLQTMRAHFDCGWWEHLKSRQEEVVGTTEYHIVIGGSYAAELGLSNAEREAEVRTASERVYQFVGEVEYDQAMAAYCRGMRERAM